MAWQGGVGVRVVGLDCANYSFSLSPMDKMQRVFVQGGVGGKEG